jgi:SAM-dependent methyltransferase
MKQSKRDSVNQPFLPSSSNETPNNPPPDLQHHLFRLTMNGTLFSAPVTKFHNILDIATGTGIWAIEIAQEHPEAAVIGTDLSPIQPSYVPPNCQFYIEDCEDPWHFSQKFDLIHGRALLSCFSRTRTVMASIFDALTPGGHFELQDICFPCKSPDGTLEGTSLGQWQSLMVDGLKNLGKDFGKVKEYGQYMKDAGFVDIVEKKYTWAIGPWIRGKKQKLWATWMMQNFLDGIHGWNMAILIRGMGWTVEEVEILLTKVREDVKDWRNVHAYVQMYVVYGRKPVFLTGDET